MEKLVSTRILTLVCGVALVVGCGSNDAKKPAKKSAAGKPAEEGGKKKPRPRPPVPATADAAIKALIHGVAEGHPDAYWRFLPRSFQRDINNVVHEIAEQADRELWRQTTATFKKLASVASTQREFFVNSSLVEQDIVDREQLQANWVPLVELVETLTTSELADQDKMKTIDGGKFLSGTGRELMLRFQSLGALTPETSSALREFVESEVKLVSTDGDAAVVRMQGPDGKPQEVAFVRIERKWIPKDLADGWTSIILQVHSTLENSIGKLSPEQSQQFLSTLANVNRMLDGLAAAKTQDEFNTALQPLVAMALFFQQRAGLTNVLEVDEDAPQAEGSVVVVLKGSVGERTVESLVTELQKANKQTSDDGDYEFTSAGDTTTITLHPVGDVKAFAERISVGRVVKVDDERRMVVVELKSNGE